jgi:hypothetical protein
VKFFITVIGLLTSLLTTSAYALTIDFRDIAIETLDGSRWLSVSRGTRTLTVTANQGVLNRTASGFGINSPGGGDDADGIDGANGVEELLIHFSAPVRQVAIALGAVGILDIGAVLAHNMAFPFARTGLLSLGALTFDVGETLSVRFVSGNGFSVNAIHFEPTVIYLASPRARTLSAVAMVILAFLFIAFGRGSRDNMRLFNFPAPTLQGRLRGLAQT